MHRTLSTHYENVPLKTAAAAVCRIVLFSNLLASSLLKTAICTRARTIPARTNACASAPRPAKVATLMRMWSGYRLVFFCQHCSKYTSGQSVCVRACVHSYCMCARARTTASCLLPAVLHVPFSFINKLIIFLFSFIVCAVAGGSRPAARDYFKSGFKSS